MLPPRVKSFFLPKYVARIIKLHKSIQQFCHFIGKKEIKNKPKIVVLNNGKKTEKNNN